MGHKLYSWTSIGVSKLFNDSNDSTPSPRDALSEGPRDGGSWTGKVPLRTTVLPKMKNETVLKAGSDLAVHSKLSNRKQLKSANESYQSNESAVLCGSIESHLIKNHLKIQMNWSYKLFSKTIFMFDLANEQSKLLHFGGDAIRLLDSIQWSSFLGNSLWIHQATRITQTEILKVWVLVECQRPIGIQWMKATERISFNKL